MPPEVGHSNTGSTNPGAALAAEDYQLKSYRNQIEQHHRNEMEEIATRNREEIQHLLEEQAKKKELLQTDFNVAISQEAEELEASLTHARELNEQRIAEEKHHADEELTKIRRANTQKMEEYKRVSNSQQESQRKELQATAETLQEKQRMLERKDRELEKAENTHTRRPKV